MRAALTAHVSPPDHRVACHSHSAFAQRVRTASPHSAFTLRALRAGHRPLPRTDHPALFRGIHTGRHKFARYFRLDSHHDPAGWGTLVRHNQLELYDLQEDPLEMNNLAHDLPADPAQVDPALRALVLELNDRTRALVAAEVGEDLGDELPGPSWVKRL